MLREGYKAEDIAQAFTDKLNGAIQTVESDTAYQDLANAWNNAVDAYCHSNKIPGAKEYHISNADVQTILGSYIELGKFIGDTVKSYDSMKNNIKNNDVVKKFFGRIGI